MGQLTEQRKDTLVRQLAALLNVLDSDVKVQRIQAHSDLRCELHTCPARSCSFPLLSSFAHTCVPSILSFSQRAAVRTASFQVSPTSLSKCLWTENVPDEGVSKHQPELVVSSAVIRGHANGLGLAQRWSHSQTSSLPHIPRAEASLNVRRALITIAVI